MHTILRNLFYTLHRFRLASVLNLIGLSVAFTAFTVILMKVNHERNFDTCYPDYEKVAFVAINDSRGTAPPQGDCPSSECTSCCCSSLL